VCYPATFLGGAERARETRPSRGKGKFRDTMKTAPLPFQGRKVGELGPASVVTEGKVQKEAERQSSNIQLVKETLESPERDRTSQENKAQDR